MPPAPFIDITQTVFPVVALHPEEDGQMAYPDFFGTAFCVSPGVFMTAAHVAREAAAAGALGVAGPAGEGAPLGAARVKEYEIWEERDIALLHCKTPELTKLDTWMTNRAQVLTDVSSFGYPHAVTWTPDGQQLNVTFRAYKGYIITTRGFDRLPNSPAVYEVSCPFPKGLSGAPVLMTHEDKLIVLGVVIGVDTVTYGGVKQNDGIGLVGEEIVGLRSKVIDGPIADKLGFEGVHLGPS